MEIFRLFGVVSINKAKAIADLKAVETAGRTSGGRLGKVFTKVGKIAKLAFAAVAIAGAAIFVASIKSAADFEQAMAAVKAVTGSTGAEFDKLTAKAKQLGKDTKFTMTEIASGMESLGRAGFATNEIIAAMDGVTALASATMMDLGSAAQITATTIRQFGLAASDADRVANVFAATAASSNTTVESLAESFKYFGPVAKTFGISVESAAGFIGKLGDAGITGTMATRTLATAMMKLAAPTEKMQTVMDDLNLEFFDAQGNFIGLSEMVKRLEFAFKDLNPKQKMAAQSALFGAQAVKQWNTILEVGSEDLDSYTDSITGTNAAFDQQAIQLDTLSGQWTILRGSISLLLQTIGEDMMPILKNVLKNAIIPWINNITTWIEKMGGIKGVVGHALIAVGEWIKGIATWIQAHTYLNKSIDDVWTILKNLGLFIKNVFTGNWAGAWENIKRVGIAALDIIKNAVLAAWNALPIPDATKQKIISVLTSIKDGAVAAFEWIKDKALKAWKGIKTSVEEHSAGIIAAWNGLKEAAGRVWDTIKEAFSSIIGKFGDVDTSALSLQGVFEKALSAALIVVTALMNGVAIFVNFILDNQEWVIAAVGGIGAAFIAWKVTTIVTSLASIATGLWGMGTAALAAIGPAGWIALMIAAMGVLAIRTIQHWDEIKKEGVLKWAGIIGMPTDAQWGAWAKELWDGFLGLLPSNAAWGTWALSIIKSIGASFVALGSDIAAIGTSIGQGIWDGLKAAWSSVVGWFSTALQDLIDTVTGWMPGWLKTWLGVGEDAGENAAQGLKNSTSDVKTAASDLKDTMVKAATPSDKEAQEIGHKLAAGTVVGWTDSQSMAVINAGAKKLTQAQIDALNAAAGIKSPATEFMPIGEAETEGIVAGMLSAAQLLIDTGKNMIKETIPPMGEEAQKAGETVGEAYTDGVSDGIKAGTPGVMDSEAEFRDGLKAAYTTSHADAIDSEKTFRDDIEAAYTTANNAEEAALAAHDANDVEEVKSFWQRVKGAVDKGTTDTAEAIGNWLNDLKSIFSNGLSSIIKDVAKAFASGDAASIPGIIGQGMLDIASSIFNSGIDKAVDWAVDKLWSLVTGAQAATSAAAGAATGAGAAGGTAAGAAAGGAGVLGTIAGIATPLLIGTGAADPFVQGVVKPWLDEHVAPVMHTILDPIGDVLSGVVQGIAGGLDWLGGLIGFAPGGVFNQPTLLPAHMVAEGGYSEAYLPLSPKVFGEIGQGIMSALTPQTPALAAAGSSIQVDMRGLYDGATINVRSDQDIKQIARETYSLYKDRVRGRGGRV